MPWGRRAKTDRLDAEGMLRVLGAYLRVITAGTEHRPHLLMATLYLRLRY
jgi:hypothetical protein